MSKQTMQLSRKPIGEPKRNVLGVQPGLTVLAIGPHCDDIELGAGSTLMWLIDEYGADVYYRSLSFDRKYAGAPYPRLVEIVRAAHRLGIDMRDLSSETRALIEQSFEGYEHADARVLDLAAMEKSEAPARNHRRHRGERPSPGLPHFDAFRFHDTRFPNAWHEVQEALERLAADMHAAGVPPDLVLFPCEDAHQDHVTTAQVVNRIFRGGETRWQWEILQFDAGKFDPNLFIDASGETAWVRQISSERDRAYLEDNRVGKITGVYDAAGEKMSGDDPPVGGWYLKTGSYAERKADLLTECFPSELQRKAPFLEPIRVLGMLASRGMQCGRNIEFAEAFKARLSIFREEP